MKVAGFFLPLLFFLQKGIILKVNQGMTDISEAYYEPI